MMLDRPECYSEIDTLDALGDVERSAQQWLEAARIPVEPLDLGGFDTVLLAGMGGSGVAGDVVATVAAEHSDLPIYVHKGYGVPRFIGPRSLVVGLSYSGNTEETLSAVGEAADRGATIAVVTTGGELGRRCEAAGWRCVVVPPDRQPRHSLGYLTVPLLRMLGLDGDFSEAVAVQCEIAHACAREVGTADNPAKQLALRIASGSVPLLYGAGPLGAVAAYRLRCQLNENAKLPVTHAQLPELNHNEVMAFTHPSALSGSWGLVLLRDPVGEHPRMAVRVHATEEVLAPHLAWTVEVVARGRATLARLASLLLLGDLASLYTAIELGRDPTPIKAIDHVKSALTEPQLIDLEDA